MARAMFMRWLLALESRIVIVEDKALATVRPVGEMLLAPVIQAWTACWPGARVRAW